MMGRSAARVRSLADETFIGTAKSDAKNWVFNNESGWVRRNQLPEKMKVAMRRDRAGPASAAIVRFSGDQHGLREPIIP
jgi:hypothetical protein